VSPPSGASSVAISVAVLAFGLAGCVVQAYPGPRRPSNQVALIETTGTKLTGVDGDAVHGSKAEVLPGRHGLAVKLDDDVPGWHLYSVHSLVVCFVARPGHAYAARPVYAGPTWRIELIDETLAERAKAWIVGDPGNPCETDDAVGEGE
jgi:hypothetical protein